MAGIIEVTRRQVNLIEIAWTGDEITGAGPDCEIGAPGWRISKVDCVAVDAAGGVADYDAEVFDVYGLDVLGGVGKGRHIIDGGELVCSQVTPLVGSVYRPVPVVGILTLKITNTNPGARGLVLIHLVPQ